MSQQCQPCPPRPVGPQPGPGGASSAHVTRIEATTPLWRLISVAAACGAVAALAYYLNAVHHADDFATVAVITTAYTVTFWAAKRPSQFAGRFGPFGKIAAAVRESQDDLRRWVMDKPLKAGAMIAACYGLAVVLAIVAGLWNPWLAVALGAGIGAVVAAPHMFAALGQRITGQNTPAPAPAVQAPEAQQQPPGPSTLRPVPPAPPAALPGDPAGPQDPPSNHSPT